MNLAELSSPLKSDQEGAALFQVHMPQVSLHSQFLFIKRMLALWSSILLIPIYWQGEENYQCRGDSERMPIFLTVVLILF